MSHIALNRVVGPDLIANRERRALLIESSARPAVLLGLVANRHHWRRFQDSANSVRCSVTFIAGELDPYAGPDATARMANSIDNSRMIRLKGCGHCIPLEAPQLLADACLDSLQALSF